jgi:hypothetical protein
MMLRDRPGQAIPVAAAEDWDPQARQTALIRYALAGALLLALAAAVSLGRNPEKRAKELFPGSESGVLVLDMSASVGSPGRLTVGALEYLERTGQEFGLVIFSDSAYEALPTGSSSAELQPYIRMFKAPPAPCETPIGATCPPGTRRMSNAEKRRARLAASRPTPWSQSFRAGTRISTGLRLARQVLHRDGMTNQGVLLLSDLDDSLSDLPVLTRELIQYEREGVPIHVVAIDPHEDDRLYFRRLAGADALVPRADLSVQRVESKSLRISKAFPSDLVLVGLLALLLLGLNEHYCGRLTWRRLGRPEASA